VDIKFEAFFFLLSLFFSSTSATVGSKEGTILKKDT